MGLFLVIAVIVIAIDQLSKLFIVNKMEIGESIELINNFLYITSHRNRGAAWGILEGQMIFFYIITIVVIIGLIYFMKTAKNKNLLLKISLGLILGGAIGNFIDRLFRKEVVDFINTYIFTYDYPVFNIADSALVIGVACLFVYLYLDEKRAKEGQDGD